jgi:hypothetical protein
MINTVIKKSKFINVGLIKKFELRMGSHPQTRSSDSYRIYWQEQRAIFRNNSGCSISGRKQKKENSYFFICYIEIYLSQVCLSNNPVTISSDLVVMRRARNIFTEF